MPNAILYQAKTGCQWRMLPHDFPPEGTVRDYFHRFKRNKTLESINTELRQRVRLQAGRNAEPSLAVIDSQSVKAARTSGERGFDGGKKNQRREAALVLKRAERQPLPQGIGGRRLYGREDEE
ncbi:MAG: transposase [Planctomycetaceae bacterium]|jgi:putative transposase|nr:transposase [Planctomycetaceae bacterium]